MSPERWQQIEALCEAALSRPAEERPAFLAQACAGDEALLEEVTSLLAAHEEAPLFLEEPVARIRPRGDQDEAAAPQLIGPYRLIRRLGQGGMGDVYLAVRDDEAFTQYVAIKLLRRGLDTADLLQRFYAERQILASLNHPNIARLFDGGATDDGLPYLVMEHVEGTAITTYCDARQLSIDGRLQLFRQVCAAVHHAHQNLIVHRDLKPSNILVTPGGVPKLLDFGIAKLLDAGQANYAVPRTQTQHRLLTPEYASPEQVRGEAITTASDVYALGVLLYELLTGRRPYRLPSRMQQEIERVICEEEPARPSTAVTQTEALPDTTGVTPAAVSLARSTQVERLRRRLAGDLDNIVLMAMRKEPTRRYSSAAQLADDLRRHLDGLPVLAQPDTFTYRARKFVRRHRWGVVSATLIALLLIGATTGMAIQSAQIQAKAAEVETERDRAEEVSRFLIDLFRASDPAIAQGDTITARALLDRGWAQVNTQLAGQPERQREMLLVISEVFETLGLYDEAAEAATHALNIQQTLATIEPADAVRGWTRLGRVLREQGQYEAADSLFRQALAGQADLGSGDQRLVSAQMEQAVLRTEQGRYDEAEPLLRQVLAAREAASDVNPRDRVTTLVNLASVLRRTGQYAEADSLYQVGLAFQRQHFGEDHPDVITTLNSLGVLYSDQGNYDAAEAAYREVIARRRRVLGASHPLVAVGLNNLGEVLRKKGAYAEAEPIYRESLALFQQELGPQHPHVATSMNNLASLLDAKGDYAEVELLYGEALAMQRRLLDPDHPSIAQTLNNLGALFRKQGRYDEAEPLFREALRLFRQIYGPEHPNTATLVHNTASLLRDKGDIAEAETHFREAVASFSKLLGAEHPNAAIATSNLAGVLRSRGSLAEADSLYRQALAVLREKLPEGHPRVAGTLTGLGQTLLDRGQPAEAEPLLREAVAIQTDNFGDADPRTAEVQTALGKCLTARGLFEEAASLLSNSLSILEAERGAGHPSTRQARVAMNALRQARPE